MTYRINRAQQKQQQQQALEGELPRVGRLPENMGFWDRIIQAAIGGYLLKTGLSAQGPEGATKPFLSILGGTMLVKSATGYDPIWQLFGLNSLKFEQTGNILADGGLSQQAGRAAQAGRPLARAFGGSR